MNRRHCILVPGVLLLAAFAGPRAQASDNDGKNHGAIHVREVAPADARAGAVLIAYGDNLNATRIKEVWLTDGKTDYKVEILEQDNNSIRFLVPATVPAGRWRIAVTSDEDMILEQPAYVNVRAPLGPVTG